MALLEEVDDGAEGSVGDAESLKTAHRRKRARGANAKARKKNRAEGISGSGWAVFGVLLPAAVVIFLGLWSRSTSMDRKLNSCKMTMSRPEYVHLPVPEYPGGDVGSEEDSPGYQYRLMRYIDRKLPASDKLNPSKPSGIPVLFVPGHLGSFKQVRSLGSLAAEAKVSSPRRRLDFFALDLLEEWTALHGSMVWRQAEFFNHAVEAILQLYDSGNAKSPVTSVMVVGHSLGGLVARAAFTLPSYRVGSVVDIVTLGTPHDRAPWMMDYSVLSLYQCTDSLWRWHSPAPSSSVFARCWSSNRPAVETEQSLHTVTRGYGNKDTEKAVEALGQEGATAGQVGTTIDACQAGDGSDVSTGDCATLSLGGASGDSATGEHETAEPGAAIDSVIGWGGAAGVDAEYLLGNTVLLSVSGGPKDLMVHPSLCVADGLGLDGQSVGFTTEVVQGCGFGVDHLALMWCKQLVSRVINTLSELERLHAVGVGAKERTRVAAGVLSSPKRSPAGKISEGVEGTNQSLASEGFEEASRAGDAFVAVARSLVTDRSYLLIPAWVCLAGLVLAAALTRGLSIKTAKERVLPPVSLLLTPQEHFQLKAVKHASQSLWTSARASGTPAIAALVVWCSAMLIWTFGDVIAAQLLGPTERFFSLIGGVPGVFMVRTAGTTVLRLVGGATSGVVQVLNPFEGARDAIRLHPAKGIMAVYVVSAGWMMAFVYVVAMLSTVGSAIGRVVRPSRGYLKAPLRFLRSRKFCAAASCAVVLAAHVEKFSLPPTFRAVTLKGELSMVFLALSLSLYMLLVSLVLFPASLPAASTHQRLLLLLYAPAPALLVGLQLSAAGVFLRGGGSHEPFVGSGELVLASLALLPMLASVWFARRARPFPSPPNIHGFLAELQAQMEEEVARANGGSVGGSRWERGSGGDSAAALAAAALERPNGHGACGKCLHADGGQGAIFVETEQEQVAVRAGVTVGPGFRVVACDCPHRERAAPSSWCEFCRCVCKVCGGCKEATRALRDSRFARGQGAELREETGLSDLLGAAAAVGLVSVAVLYVGLWAFGMRIMAAPCHSLGALAAMGCILCGLHWGVARDAAKGARAS